MEKQFVPYGLSVKLKELGFDEECFGFYNNADGNVWIKHLIDDSIKTIYTGDIKAPLWQQAFNWCLDKLKLIESYAIIIDSDSYSLVIMDYYYNNIKENLTQSPTKEECLEKLIELCKKEIK